MNGADERRSLEDLVVECLERVETEGERAIEDLLRAHPDRAAELRAHFERLRATGLLALARPGGSFPERLGDFRILRRLGEGGMGVVFLAEQTSLGRKVALKIVRPEHLYFSGARERFRREVEAVARLSHASIVPVHMVGEDGGIPYYAMEHVAGFSLAEVIAHLRGRAVESLRGSDLREFLAARREGDSSSDAHQLRGTWVECCLAIARDAALALEHAHARGVLHRDVKPSNVMLTHGGRVLLLDFGLAALQGSERLTGSGARLGSLAYMAPEQIEGRADAIGPATDVYALGATLHEMLTLRLPFPGDSAEEILRRVRESAPEPMRRLNPAVSADVETVVLAALDPDPARRYASAEAFARDLANVLELRPIEARRTSTALRARRWTQRHPGWTAAFGLAAAVVVAGPLIFGLQERSARIAVGRQRDLAQENLASALEAVDFVTALGESELASIPQAEDVRRRLLEKALEFYRRFAARGENDRTLELETVEAERRVGGILWLLGRQTEAREALERSCAGFEALGGSGASPAVRDALAASRLQLSDALRMTGDVSAADALLRRSLAELEPCVPADGGLRDDRVELAKAQRSLADISKQRGDRAAARELLEAALATLAPLARDPADSYAALLEAGARTRLAQIEVQLGDPARAEESLARAAERISGGTPTGEFAIQVRELRAQIEDQTAQLLAARADLPAAVAHALLAVEARAALDADFPRVARYRDQLAVSLVTLGSVLAGAGRGEEALVHQERAVALLEDLRRDFPETLTYRIQLAGARVGMVRLLDDAQRFDEADALGERTLRNIDAGSVADAELRGARNDLLLEQARALLARERVAEAARALDGLAGLESPADLCQAARIAALCSASGGSGPSAADDDDAARWRGRAVDFLLDAAARGLRDRARVEGDPSFAALRGDPRFEALLGTLSGG